MKKTIDDAVNKIAYQNSVLNAMRACLKEREAFIQRLTDTIHVLEERLRELGFNK